MTISIHLHKVPAHYVGGVGVTVSYPEGTLTPQEKSLIEEELRKLFSEIPRKAEP
jgi:hypothetical protein